MPPDVKPKACTRKSWAAGMSSQTRIGMSRSILDICVYSNACDAERKGQRRSQPPVTFDLSLSESAGSRSLDRLVRPNCAREPRHSRPKEAPSAAPEGQGEISPAKERSDCRPGSPNHQPQP